MVVDTTLVVTLSAEPMEIVAGDTTMITATANRYDHGWRRRGRDRSGRGSRR